LAVLGRNRRRKAGRGEGATGPWSLRWARRSASRRAGILRSTRIMAGDRLPRHLLTGNRLRGSAERRRLSRRLRRIRRLAVSGLTVLLRRRRRILRLAVLRHAGLRMLLWWILRLRVLRCAGHLCARHRGTVATLICRRTWKLRSAGILSARLLRRAIRRGRVLRLTLIRLLRIRQRAELLRSAGPLLRVLLLRILATLIRHTRLLRILAWRGRAGHPWRRRVLRRLTEWGLAGTA